MNFNSIQKLYLKNEDSLPPRVFNLFTPNTFDLERLVEQRAIEMHIRYHKAYQDMCLETFSMKDVKKMIDSIQLQENPMPLYIAAGLGKRSLHYSYVFLLRFMCQHLIYSKKDMMFDLYFFDVVYCGLAPDLSKSYLRHDFGYAAFGNPQIIGEKSGKEMKLGDTIAFNKKIPVIFNENAEGLTPCAPTQISNFPDNYVFLDNFFMDNLCEYDQKITDLFFDTVKVITSDYIICDSSKSKAFKEALREVDIKLSSFPKGFYLEDMSSEAVEKITTYLELQ